MNFGAGLTPKMMDEIQKADALEISDKLGQKGIPSDFKDNKVVAWGCAKTVEIFEQINKKYGTNLALPRGIYVEDFEKLNIEDKNAVGFCNMAPTYLIKGSNDITPSRVIYFDTLNNKREKAHPNKKWLYDWNNINAISDYNFITGGSGTNFVLDVFIHEPSHVEHEEHLLDLYDGEVLLEMLKTVQSPAEVLRYQKKYGSQVSRICDYAMANPLEAVACDLSRQIVSSLDKNTLIPIKNPFARIPYQNQDLSLTQRIQARIQPLNSILRNFWNGKFD